MPDSTLDERYADLLDGPADLELVRVVAALDALYARATPPTLQCPAVDRLIQERPSLVAAASRVDTGAQRNGRVRLANAGEGIWAVVEAWASRPRGLAPVLQVVVAVAVSLALTAGVVLAVSPDVRERLRTTLTGAQGQGSRVTSLEPAPPFAVLQPVSLPSGMRLIAYAYAPGLAAPGQPARPTLSTSVGRLDGRGVDAATTDRARDRIRRLVSDGHGPMLVLIYAAEGDQFVEVVEQAAGGRALPAGEPLALRGASAVLAQRDGRTVLSWAEQGTFVELYTTLGRTEALRVAEGLQTTTLDAFGAVLSPPAGPGPALRAAAIASPQGGGELAAQRCGPWQPLLYQTDPPAGFRQALCVARLASGAEEGTGYALDRSTWRDAAQRLALNSSVLPPPPPLPGQPVWLVYLGGSAAAGRGEKAVIIDGETGQPYLVVDLRTGP